MTRSEKINDKYGFDTASETVAIHKSENEDTVILFKKISEFTDEFIQLYQNGEIWGVYYNEKGDIVAQVNGEGTIENILVEDIE